MSDNKVETELLSQIKEVLLKFPKYWEKDVLLRNKVAEDLRNYNQELIKALLSNKLVKDTYSITLDKITIFKIEDFISMLRYKNYWENSYTKYTNEIGLTSEGKYLNYNTDVVLDFPHKDGILEGGMTQEDLGKKEIFYHNVLAKEEIDTLLTPKTFKNTMKYDQYGKHYITSFTGKDNLIIKGNNLIALHSLKDKYAGKIKLIYIDPPYNTGNDSFKYNDRFSRSSWLTFMRNRLEFAFSLLSEDGSIFIQCDENQQAYLKVLCDEIFGEENFVNNISVKMSEPSGTKMAHVSKRFSKMKESILLYKKSDFVNYNPIKISKAEWDSEYNKFLLNFTRKDKDKIDELVNKISDGYIATEEDINCIDKIFEKVSLSSISNEFKKESNNTDYYNWLKENSYRIFRTAASSSVKRLADLKRKIKQNTIFSVLSARDGLLYLVIGDYSEASRSPRVQVLFAEDYLTTYLGDFWGDIPTTGLEAEGNVELKNGKKPEKLLKRIIEFSTNPNDIVLDFFMGSGTTQAVSMKMNRQFIGIEQMDYINTVTVPRLQKVIKGEQSGISKEVDWNGGGSFVYTELFSLNDEYIKEIQISKNEEDLEKVVSGMKEKAYLNFKVDLEKISSKNEGYNNLLLEEKKEVLIQVLDMNQLYLGYSEIEDEQYDISEGVKAFNHSFYQKEGVKDE